MNMWDQRYSEDEFAYGTTANDFLCEHYTAIRPGGRVLCLAEGEGRNAVFLAKQGYQVTAVDLSATGLSKAQKLAEELGVSITTEVADLADYDFGHQRWDGVVSISAHLPSTVRQQVHANVLAALAPGGWLILEAYTVEQLEMPGMGGPPAAQIDAFMSLSQLHAELAGLHFHIAQEIHRTIREGKYHRGDSAVVQVVAQK